MTDKPAPIDVAVGTARPLSFRIVTKSVRVLLGALFGFTIEGKEHVPTTGPFILVGNHLHNADPVFVEVACPRMVMFMAKDDLFKYQGIKQIISWVGAFPVQRGKMDRGAIKHAQEVLKQGHPLGIFPEGTRSKSMKIEKVLPGAGMFAVRGDYPIVPCAIIGSERLPFNGAKQHHKTDMADRNLSHRGVKVVFGKPFTVPPTIDGVKTNSESATNYMMQVVADMLPEPYRGIYGEKP